MVGGDVFEGSVREECWKEKEKRVEGWKAGKKIKGCGQKNKHHVRHGRLECTRRMRASGDFSFSFIFSPLNSLAPSINNLLRPPPFHT